MLKMLKSVKENCNLIFSLKTWALHVSTRFFPARISCREVSSQLLECIKNIARVRNCTDVTILNYLFGLCLLSFSLYVFLSFCLFVFMSFFCLFVFYVFLSFSFFVDLSADQVSEGSQVSNVTLCVKIQKWHSVTD